MPTIDDDPRVDPRLKAAFGGREPESAPPIPDRDTLLAMAQVPEIRQGFEEGQKFWDSLDSEEIAPSAGLRLERHDFPSQPDGNQIAINFIRPDDDEARPCVVFVHGGGMMSGSAFDGNYRAFGKTIAANDVAVALIEFRNSVFPATNGDIAPYPGGQNDVLSGLRWVLDHAVDLGIDPTKVVLAGESGGANLIAGLTIRLGRDGETELVRGLFMMCPFLAGAWPQERFPSSTENNGIMLDLHDALPRIAYGIEAFDAGDAAAWPSFATEADVAHFPPTVITVDECDPLRDEGVAFYRLLVAAGVEGARCTEVIGGVHGAEIQVAIVPDIARSIAASIAHFARTI